MVGSLPNATSRRPNLAGINSRLRPRVKRTHRSEWPPPPEVFIPAFAARAALQPQPAMPPALTPRPSLH